MNLVGITDPECVLKDVKEGTLTEGCKGYPPVASNMIWELIKDVNGGKNYGVKFSFNGEYLDFCKNERKDQQGQFYCTWNEFESALEKHYMYKDYSKACGWETPD